MKRVKTEYKISRSLHSVEKEVLVLEIEVIARFVNIFSKKMY